MTPLLAGTSAIVTVAISEPTITPAEVNWIVRLSPFAAATVVVPSAKSVDITVPGTTWYSRISASAAISSSVLKLLKSIPAAANASSVGANTVYSSSPDNVSTRPAAPSAATNDVWMDVAAAVVGRFTAAVHMYPPHTSSET